jgi:hypothetical protein
VAGQEGLAVEIVDELVAGADAAEVCHFPGSPTVRVEGRDVQPEIESLREYGLG